MTPSGVWHTTARGSAGSALWCTWSPDPSTDDDLGRVRTRPRPSARRSRATGCGAGCERFCAKTADRAGRVCCLIGANARRGRTDVRSAAAAILLAAAPRRSQRRRHRTRAQPPDRCVRSLRISGPSRPALAVPLHPVLLGYALEALETHGSRPRLWLTVRRLLVAGRSAPPAGTRFRRLVCTTTRAHHPGLES